MTTTIEKYYGLLKQKLEKQNIQGLCSDIDETLSATNLYFAQHHIKNFGNPECLSAEEIIKKYRFASLVPYWGNNEMAEKWIKQKFESNDGRFEVLPIENALESIKKIERITPIVAYLTGRPEHINEGTKKWLMRYDFPIRDIIAQPAIEILKEMGVSKPGEWKARVLEFMYPQINGIIDDLEDITNHLSPDYKGTIYLYSHKYYKDHPMNIIGCPTWADVIKKVEEQRNNTG